MNCKCKKPDFRQQINIKTMIIRSRCIKCGGLPSKEWWKKYKEQQGDN